MSSSFSTVAITLLAASLLAALPIPELATPYWPEWVALATIYWCVNVPEKYSVGFAWMIGLICDFVSGSIPGLNALVFAALAYLLISFNYFVRNKSLLQQSLIIGTVFLPCLLLKLWISNILNVPADNQQIWPTALANAVIWPWIYAIITSLQQRRA